MEQPKDLILLVGSNPLPNYVAVAMLRPERVHLVYSQQTEQVMKRLKECIETPPLSIPVEQAGCYGIQDANNVREIRDLVKRLPCGAALHYTGGTKRMSTHIHAGCLEREGRRDEHASYLDDEKDLLRFDSGEDSKLEEKCFI